MGNKDFYAGTATSFGLGIVFAIEEAAIAAAGTTATGVAAGTGALVGGIVTASLCPTHRIIDRRFSK